MRQNPLFSFFNAIIFTFLIGSVASCKKTPEACLNASNKSVQIGESIQFSDCSTNNEDGFRLSLSEYHNLNGNISTGLPITYSYRAGGTYQVGYKVDGEKEDSEEIFETIVVDEVTKSDLFGTWNFLSEMTYNREDFVNETESTPATTLYNWDSFKLTFSEDSITTYVENITGSGSYSINWSIKPNPSVFDYPYIYTNTIDPLYEIRRISASKLDLIILDDEWIILHFEKE
jgi:hypothetical protein